MPTSCLNPNMKTDTNILCTIQIHIMALHYTPNAHVLFRLNCLNASVRGRFSESTHRMSDREMEKRPFPGLLVHIICFFLQVFVCVFFCVLFFCHNMYRIFPNITKPVPH